MPRHRETLLLRLTAKLHTGRQNGDQDDTAIDPPRIPTLNDLVAKLEYAQAVLERYQLSTRGGRLRQMIPISLRQLTSVNWAEADEWVTEDE